MKELESIKIVLWIAFKFITFDTLETTSPRERFRPVSVVNRFQIYYLWHIGNNSPLYRRSRPPCCESLSNLLPLTHWKQLLTRRGFKHISCESLSNLLPLTHWKQPHWWMHQNNQVVNRFQIYYLWHIVNNFLYIKWSDFCVVNRFQIYYLWHIGNNENYESRLLSLLWIAFKFITFDTLETTLSATGRGGDWLWIAFKFITFDTLETTRYA